MRPAHIALVTRLRCRVTVVKFVSLPRLPWGEIVLGKSLFLWRLGSSQPVGHILIYPRQVVSCVASRPHSVHPSLSRQAPPHDPVNGTSPFAAVRAPPKDATLCGPAVAASSTAAAVTTTSSTSEPPSVLPAASQASTPLSRLSPSAIARGPEGVHTKLPTGAPPALRDAPSLVEEPRRDRDLTDGRANNFLLRVQHAPGRGHLCFRSPTATTIATHRPGESRNSSVVIVCGGKLHFRECKSTLQVASTLFRRR